MGILKLEGKQQVEEKKSLPKKPKETEHSTDNFCNNLLDISLEENLWVAGVEKQVILSTPEPFIEDCFKSIWEIKWCVKTVLHHLKLISWQKTMTYQKHTPSQGKI